MSWLVDLLPYLKRVWRLLLASCAAAAFVALLWATALSLAFPLVKVLLEDQSFAEHVQLEIRQAETDLAQYKQSLEWLEATLSAAKLAGMSTRDPVFVETLKRQSQLQRRSGSAAWRLFAYSWLDSWLIPYLPTTQFRVLTLVLLVLLGLTVVKGWLTYWHEVLIGRAVESVMRAIRQRLFRHTLGLDLQTVGQLGTPQLMARFTNDLQQMAQGLALLGGRLIVEPMKLGFCLVGAFCVNWQLTLISLLVAPVGGVIFGMIGKRIRKASKRQMETVSQIYGTLEETFRVFPMMLAFRNEDWHRGRLVSENRQYYRKAVKIIKADAIASPVTELLATVGVFLALLPGAYLVLRKQTDIYGIDLAPVEMEIADLSLLYAYLGGMLDPIRKLSSVYSKMKKSSVACERIFSVMRTPCALPVAKHPQALPAGPLRLEFESVSFSYASPDGVDEARPPALDLVSLKVEPGETVAIVGGNGSGKSTLVSLIPRFFDPSHGQIRLGGVDLRKLNAKDLRQAIGIVSQGAALFDETILKNIAAGDLAAGPEAIEASAAQASVTLFTERLPMGLETPVGERGNLLSGGQRQRVALARAFLRSPRVLILDEATSAIDAHSEHLIYGALAELRQDRTTLIITHSLSPQLLGLVSRIVMMEQGQVVGVGPHQQLLRTCPPYQRLFAAQESQRVAA